RRREDHRGKQHLLQFGRGDAPALAFLNGVDAGLVVLSRQQGFERPRVGVDEAVAWPVVRKHGNAVSCSPVVMQSGRADAALGSLNLLEMGNQLRGSLVDQPGDSTPLAFRYRTNQDA